MHGTSSGVAGIVVILYSFVKILNILLVCYESRKRVLARQENFTNKKRDFYETILHIFDSLDLNEGRRES